MIKATTICLRLMFAIVTGLNQIPLCMAQNPPQKTKGPLLLAVTLQLQAPSIHKITSVFLAVLSLYHTSSCAWNWDQGTCRKPQDPGSCESHVMLWSNRSRDLRGSWQCLMLMSNRIYHFCALLSVRGRCAVHGMVVYKKKKKHPKLRTKFGPCWPSRLSRTSLWDTGSNFRHILACAQTATFAMSGSSSSNRESSDFSQ